jgi:aryl-alcohol dehydrogenase-like predicted oxidoreductase
MQTDQIGELLQRLGQALSSGDFREAARCWQLPALLLHEETAKVVSDAGEIESFYTGAAEWYHSQGIVSTRPDIERVEHLSETLAAADVRWPSLDAAGSEKSSERSHYIVQLGEDGRAGIRVALSRTK